MDTNFQIDIEQLLQIKCPPGFGRDPIGSCSPYEFTISDTHPSIIALMKWCNLTVLYHGASNIFLTSDSIPVAYKLHARTFYGAHIFLREWDSDTYAQKQIVIPPIDRVKQDFVTDTQWFQGRELKELMLIMNGLFEHNIYPKTHSAFRCEFKDNVYLPLEGTIVDKASAIPESFCPIVENLPTSKKGGGPAIGHKTVATHIKDNPAWAQAQKLGVDFCPHYLNGGGYNDHLVLIDVDVRTFNKVTKNEQGSVIKKS